MTMKAPSAPCLRALRAILDPKPHRARLTRTYATEPPPTPPPTRLRNKTTITPPEPLDYKPTPQPPAPSQPAALEYKPTPKPKNQFLDPGAKDSDDPVPRPLIAPLGLPTPPRAGQNTGVDNRTWKQRRDDFVDYDKHLARRQDLTKTLYRPYFRDFSAMRHFKGKTFLANERLFRGPQAMFFPNLRGRTLEGKEGDTTGVLEGRVSVVAVFSSGWAENQVKTFVGKEENPGLHEVLREGAGAGAQVVEVNVETNALKWWILRLFTGRLRGMREKKDWNKYFVVRRGFGEVLREEIGAMNSRVGYVYLLDRECRIRWAGSARAMDDEKESLVRGLRRLLAEPKIGKKDVEAKTEKADSVMEPETL